MDTYVWNTEAFFSGLESDDFQAAYQNLLSDVQAVEEWFKSSGIAEDSHSDNDGATIARAIAHLNTVYTQYRLVRGYVYMFISTDANNTRAQSIMSELSNKTRAMNLWSLKLSRFVKNLDLHTLTQHHPELEAHAYFLEQSQKEAVFQMSPVEEDLASELNLSGGSAWVKLHGNLSSNIQVPIVLEGKEQILPITAVRNLAADPSRDVRKTAHYAEMKALKDNEIALAACFNGYKGHSLTLHKRRGYSSVLAASLQNNGIDSEVLDAMQSACVESFPHFRRYWHAKAKALKVERLAFYDLSAPVGESATEWSYEAGADFIVEQFGSYSQKMADYAKHAFDDRWLDVFPRAGKRSGAFCMTVRPGESRILLNHANNLDTVSTIAHELGHGYHNLCLKGKTAIQSFYPMTLAETASIFCETIIVEAALKQASGAEKLYILETQLQGHSQVVVDIHSRFLFEQAALAKRAERDLTPEELNNFMLDAQRETYGDGLNDELNPYRWASKPHYYGSNFYNYPYTFGLLFGLGLYAQYLQNPETFKAHYDELLASTGLADAPTLASRFGFDLRDKAFWQSSLSTIEQQIQAYVDLVDTLSH